LDYATLKAESLIGLVVELVFALTIPILIHKFTWELIANFILIIFKNLIAAKIFFLSMTLK